MILKFCTKIMSWKRFCVLFFKAFHILEMISCLNFYRISLVLLSESCHSKLNTVLVFFSIFKLDMMILKLAPTICFVKVMLYVLEQKSKMFKKREVVLISSAQRGWIQPRSIIYNLFFWNTANLEFWITINITYVSQELRGWIIF